MYVNGKTFACLRELKTVAFAAVVGLAPGAALATNWYVDGLNGKLNNSGTAASPFANGWQAMAVVRPGDTVYVLPTTTYTRLSVTTSGTAANWINVVGAGLSPKLTRVAGTGTDSAIWINADYVSVSNFDASAVGQFNAVSLAPYHHHVTIARSVTHDAGGSGINIFGDDYVTVSHNVVYGNAKDTAGSWQGSGISMLGPVDIDSNTGIKNVIDGNTVYANTNVPYCFDAYCWAHQLDSDGSGIILDDFRRERFDSIAYRGRTLVSNNVVFGNGGRGIYMYRGDHASIIGNTVFSDNLDPYGGNWHPGEVGLDEVGDVVVANNILYNDGKNGPNRTGTEPNFHVGFSAENCTVGAGIGSVTVTGNVMYNPTNTSSTMSYMRGNTTPFYVNGNAWTNPTLKGVSLDPAIADFRPLPGSPALSLANPAFTLTYDALWARRVGAMSVGAYEFAAP